MPLVDASLLRQLATALVSQQRLDGKRLLADSPQTPLPREVVMRSKSGFSTPIDRWLQQIGSLMVWSEVPTLARPGCPWARRWAYEIATSQRA